MKTSDNQYERKAQYNPNRQTYVDENGNYVYLIWDEETQDYRREVFVVGDGGISPELRATLDEMDAEEERRLDADRHHIFTYRAPSIFPEILSSYKWQIISSINDRRLFACSICTVKSRRVFSDSL